MKLDIFTCEFKAKVALEAVRGIKAMNEIGQEYPLGAGIRVPGGVIDWYSRKVLSWRLSERLRDDA